MNEENIYVVVREDRDSPLAFDYDVDCIFVGDWEDVKRYCDELTKEIGIKHWWLHAPVIRKKWS